MFAKTLFHQQHLTRALDRAVQTSLVMSRQPRVFPREYPALVGDELLQQGDILEIERIDREIDLGLGPGSTHLAR
jgi:hypothetical protein